MAAGPDAGKPLALLVAGPTASGKSALALGLAERVGGTVINADSMQVYAELRVLTARPTPEDERLVPHALYGVRPAAEPGSAAWYREAALAAMSAAREAGRVPILCGGTGLYVAALMQGLAPIPDPGPAARAEAREQLACLGPTGLHARLARADPETAARLRPSDSQRIARAWEVWRGTGRGLAAWQREPGESPPWRFRAVVLDPPREALRAAIAARCRAMVAGGVLAEVEALLALGLPASLPAMRAHGVAAFGAFLRGEITLGEAERRTAQVTAQYVKRQSTWLRHRMPTAKAATRIIAARFERSAQFKESDMAELRHFLVQDG